MILILLQRVDDLFLQNHTTFKLTSFFPPELVIIFQERWTIFFLFKFYNCVMHACQICMSLGVPCHSPDQDMHVIRDNLL